MHYVDVISNHKEALEKRLNADDKPTALETLAPLRWDDEHEADNKLFLKWAKAKGRELIRDRDVAKAQHRARVIEALGKYPANAMGLIEILADLRRARVTYNGLLTALDVHAGERTEILITDFARDARITAADLRLELAREEINDAADQWFARAKRARFNDIRNSIAARADFDWLDVARNCFHTGEDMSAELVAAVLRKFVHQVVSKMHRATVGWHLMPILVGPQGEGKSYFIEKLTGPLCELMRQTDFKALTDDRNIELWNSSILFLDEMSYASRSDVEAVKHVITADTLDRRPMRSNGIQQVRQCATMIGASNKEVEENIRDETGARRFFGLRFKRPPAGFLQGLDWSAAWQSVKHTDADPLEEHRAEVARIQAATRYRSPVEDWIENIGEYSAGTIQAGEKLRIKDLYDDYLSHRRAVTGDRDPVVKTMDQFSIELARLIRNAGDDSKMAKDKDRKGAFYMMRGQPALRVVQ
ncbi:hypothetical protein HH800_15750 [Sphingobium yanoikuyae]|uniref:Virulence-associated protein E-like domain-containing protein n=1 Tax=Sphingobium yanoikuyae TaxID=13690 RepID=A0A6M4GA97_SPHYA|nr:VapE domain-containing protein [Sphingobium yanoikuyae]QJR03504.1 hypothetical protein HH800_15750 [Sphingobium yanoikuyae]